MPDEIEEPTNESEIKPTITIAEKEASASAAAADGKPTITIAEKDGGE